VCVVVVVDVVVGGCVVVGGVGVVVVVFVDVVVGIAIRVRDGVVFDVIVTYGGIYRLLFLLYTCNVVALAR
jgi:hypothetical protein